MAIHANQDPSARLTAQHDEITQTLTATTFGYMHPAQLAAQRAFDAARIAERPELGSVRHVRPGAAVGQGPAVAERVKREPIDLDTLGSKDRIAALHFDLARSWAHGATPEEFYPGQAQRAAQDRADQPDRAVEVHGAKCPPPGARVSLESPPGRGSRLGATVRGSGEERS